MRVFTIAASVLLLLGGATLFAEPEERTQELLGYTFEVEIPATQGDALVKALAEKPAWQAHVNATFLRIDATHADEVLGEHRPDEQGSARSIPAKLARALVARVRGQGPVRTEPLPPLILYDGLTGRLSVTGRHTYLQDYDAEIHQDSFTVEAIAGRIEDGARVDVTPRREGKRLRLDVEAAWALVLRPVERFETQIAKRDMVAIELPEVRMVQVREQVEVPAEGGFLLAGGGGAWDGETLRLVVLEVRAP